MKTNKHTKISWCSQIIVTYFQFMEFYIINSRKTVKLKFIKTYFLKSDQMVE